MRIRKELLLFCALLVLSFALLVGVGQAKTPDPAIQRCKGPSKCCQETSRPQPQISPWNFITEGVLHIAAV
jgi:hypothetical protein